MSRSDRYDDEDDDRPSRRRRRDEDDDRPSRRSRRDEDEDGPARPPRRAGADGLGISAMIVGIMSILIDLVTPFGACICPFIIIGAVLGLIGGVVAVVLGFAGRSRTGSGMSMAGIITGFIAIALALAMGVLVIAGVGFLALNAPPPQNNPNNPPFNNPRRF